MDVQSACEKCGLKAVRYELERQGIVLRFCDACYWGELETDANAAKSDAVREQADPASYGR